MWAVNSNIIVHLSALYGVDTSSEWLPQDCNACIGIFRRGWKHIVHLCEVNTPHCTGASIHLSYELMSYQFLCKRKSLSLTKKRVRVCDGRLCRNKNFFFTGTFVNMCHDITCTLCVRMYMLVYVQTGWCMGLIPCIGFTIDQAGCGLLPTVAWEPQSTYCEQIHTECSTVWFLGLKLGVRYESCVIRQSGDIHIFMCLNLFIKRWNHV